MRQEQCNWRRAPIYEPIQQTFERPPKMMEHSEAKRSRSERSEASEAKRTWASADPPSPPLRATHFSSGTTLAVDEGLASDGELPPIANSAARGRERVGGASWGAV